MNIQETDNHKYNRCTEHRLEMTLFCTEDDCNKTICSRCFLGDHRGHNVMDVDEEQEKFEQVKVSLERLILTVRAHLNCGREKIERHFLSQDSFLRDIEEEFEDLVHYLISQKQEELAEMKQACLTIVQSLIGRVDEVGERLNSMDRSTRMNARQIEQMQWSLKQSLENAEMVAVPKFDSNSMIEDFEDKKREEVAEHLTNPPETEFLSAFDSLDLENVITGKRSQIFPVS